MDRVQVSNDGGTRPLWSPDGSELFYLQPGIQLISVSVDGYDVSPEAGPSWLVKAGGAAGGGASPEIHVVLNWFEEIRQRMGN